MAYEDLTPEEQQQMSAMWENYNQPTDNSFMANMLRNYTAPNAQEPEIVGLDQKERLAKLLQGSNYQQPTYQRTGNQMQMPNMMGMGQTQTIGEVSGIPANYQLGTGTVGNKYAASQGYEPLNHAEYNNVVGTIDDAGGIESVGGGGNTGLFGNGGSLGGGWASAAGGALAGYNQGAQNYRDDPNMWSGKDGYGKYHKDYRAELGGGTLGGVMGYWGGPIGAALAGPTVKAVHPIAEKTTRNVINFGDKVGGAWGGVSVDPVGALASGKYSWGQAAKGMALGPFDKLFK